MIEMWGEFQAPGAAEEEVDGNGCVVDLRGVEVGMAAEAPGVGLLVGYVIVVMIVGGGRRKGMRRGSGGEDVWGRGGFVGG